MLSRVNESRQRLHSPTKYDKQLIRHQLCRKNLFPDLQQQSSNVCMSSINKNNKQSITDKPTELLINHETNPSNADKYLQVPSTGIKKKSNSKQLKITRNKERKEKRLKNSQPSDMNEALGQETLQKNCLRENLTQVTKNPSCCNASVMSTSGIAPKINRSNKLIGASTINSGSKVCDQKQRTKDEYENPFVKQLHGEIEDYASCVKNRVESMTAHITDMINNVQLAVEALWPKTQVETFGSYSTGIWLPSSDIDLVILNVVEVNDRVLIIHNLRELQIILEKKVWVDSITLLETAKIPVLKLVTAGTPIPIDITFESASTHSGLMARDLIKNYASEMPELYPLAIIFKQLLRERDLNDSYTGGLGSYSIVLMIIHFLLLQKKGNECFEAASIYASGSMPPSPKEMKRRKRASASHDTNSRHIDSNEKTDINTKKVDKNNSMWLNNLSLAEKLKSTTIPERQNGNSPSCHSMKGSSSNTMQSFAAVSTLSCSNNSNYQSNLTNNAMSPQFSYAAVAAGIAKPSDDKKLLNAPYAAALAGIMSKKKNYMQINTPIPSAISAIPSAPMLARQDCSPQATTLSCGHYDCSISSTSSNADTDELSCNGSISSTPVEEEDDDTINSSIKRISLGQSTIMILEFFGILFDYSKNGLSIRDGGYIYRLSDHLASLKGKSSNRTKVESSSSISQTTSGQADSSPTLSITKEKVLTTTASSILVIEDPIHPDRNVSSSSFAFSRVVSLFEDSYYTLKYYRPSRFSPTVLGCIVRDFSTMKKNNKSQSNHALTT